LAKYILSELHLKTKIQQLTKISFCFKENMDKTHHARDEVLALPELVSAILLHLPLQDLLVNAQLVSYSWNHIIKTSIPLQQHLFFSPLPLPKLSTQSSQPPHFNPLLQASFPSWFTNKSTRFGRGDQFATFPWKNSPMRVEAFMRKGASWRKMLPIQPPVRNFKVVKHLHFQMRNRVQKGQVTFKDGVRMGVLYDYAYETVRRPISSFSMKWQIDPVVDEKSRDGELECLGNLDNEDEGEEKSWLDEVVMTTHYTSQCSRGMADDVKKEMRSEEYEDVGLMWEA
jgi:hypothetical protein